AGITSSIPIMCFPPTITALHCAVPRISKRWPGVVTPRALPLRRRRDGRRRRQQRCRWYRAARTRFANAIHFTRVDLVRERSDETREEGHHASPEDARERPRRAPRR